MIPYGKQHISDEDISSVIDVLKSDYLTQGPKLPEFENALAKYCSAEYAVAVNSATSALHIACLALGLQKGDYLWTSPITFVASANCALYCGAKVDFVDIDDKTYNMSAEKLEAKLVSAREEGKLPKILIPVHFAGQSCEMKRIYELSKEYGFKIIEDASHAIGGRYDGLAIGGCQFSDITIFSLHPVKIITSAEGGVATTNSSELAQKMQLLRSHAVTRDTSLMESVKEGEWYYEQIGLGFNYRMTELQAALGLSQLSNLDKFVKKRHEIKLRYDELLKDLPLILPFQSHESYSSLHLYPIQIASSCKKTRLEVFSFMREYGVGVNVHYIPVHTQPYFRKMGFTDVDFPGALSYYSACISIPMYPDLTNDLQQEVANVLTKALCG